MTDYFKILNISPTNSFEEIKKAYRDQVFKSHPDRAKINNLNFDEANKITQNIIAAYQYIIANFDICRNSFEKAASSYSVEWEERTKVNSSNVDWVEYYAKLRILIVAFKSGGIYLYEQLPINIYNGLINASSKGKYMRQYISYSFKYHKLETYDEWYSYAKKSYDSK
jgi:hypothetical protein